MPTAITIGSTGLVGSCLLKELINNSTYDLIRVFTRRSTGITHPKIEEHIIDFDHPEQWESKVKGDVLFSTLGTTRVKAGGKNPQLKVDYTYQYEFARIASTMGVPVYVLVSSAGASATSPSFYMRMKGRLDEDVTVLSFDSINILRPGALRGERSEPRPIETFGIKILTALANVGLLSDYKPIHACQVARAMLLAARNQLPGYHIYQPGRLFAMADEFLKTKFLWSPTA